MLEDDGDRRVLRRPTATRLSDGDSRAPGA